MFFARFPGVWFTWTLAIVCIVDVVRNEDVPAAQIREIIKNADVNKETDNSDSTRNSFYTQACPPDDQSCKKDPFGFEAIQLLHAQIDDDQNGNVDREESDEFLRDDLKVEDGLRSDLHGSDDLISVQDLWKLWSSSDAYRWTVDDVIDWLTVHVELPQYTINFRINDVNGQMLPRLTSHSPHSLLSIIGIKNPVHRQKLALKAADVVLFGPPKNAHNVIKDIALVASLVTAVSGCYFAYFQHRKSQFHLQKVIKDLKALQRAEDALCQLQTQLKKAQAEQQVVVSAKHDVERKLKEEIANAKAEAERLRVQRENLTKEHISCLKLAEDELTQLRKALAEAERQLQSRSSVVASDLQQWLQLTYEVETKYFETKRRDTEQQLKEAREMCDKIRKQKDKFFGSFHVAHTNSLDDTDDKILRVRRALEDVKKDLQERSFRWKEIEGICGFNIIINPGIPYLNSFLRRTRFVCSTGQPFQTIKKRGSSLFADEDLDEGVSTVTYPQSYSSQQVLPNLMRAGMQLSAVGCNLAGMNSSQMSSKDTDPSSVSKELSTCESTHSLASLGSLRSLQLYGNLSDPTMSANRCFASSPSASEPAVRTYSTMPNGSGFLRHENGSSRISPMTEFENLDVTQFPHLSQTTIEKENEALLASGQELESPVLEETSDEVASQGTRKKPKQSRKKLPFSKLLKGSSNKEKLS